MVFSRRSRGTPSTSDLRAFHLTPPSPSQPSSGFPSPLGRVWSPSCWVLLGQLEDTRPQGGRGLAGPWLPSRFQSAWDGLAQRWSGGGTLLFGPPSLSGRSPNCTSLVGLAQRLCPTKLGRTGWGCLGGGTWLPGPPGLLVLYNMVTPSTWAPQRPPMLPRSLEEGN